VDLEQRPAGPARAGSVARAATLISVAMAVSRILGFVRNSVISFEFGQNRATDILNASYYVPDTLYLILVGGGMSTAFIPILSRYLAQRREDQAWYVASVAYNLVLGLLLVVLAAAIVFTPAFMRLVVPGFGPTALADVVLMTRIMFLSILFHCLNAVLMGVEYAYQSFWGTAIGPLVYNVAIIAVGVALARVLPHGPGPIDMRVEGFAIATVVAAFLNFAIQVWGVARLRPRYTPALDWRHEGIARLARLSLPVMIGLSFVQINFFINQSVLASSLPAGSINALTLASRVVLVPIMVAISIGIAALPSLSQVALARDWPAYRSLFSGALRTVVFLSLPASAGLVVLARPIVAVLFQHGAFDAADTAVTARALIGYSFGIVAYAAYEIVSRGFYALEDTRTPLLASLVNLVLSFGMNVLGVTLFHLFGLALAYSASGFVNIALLTYLLRRRLRRRLGLVSAAGSFLRTLAASVAMAVLVLALRRALAGLPILVQLVVPLTAGVGVFAVLAVVLRIPEMAQTLRFVRRRLGHA
jgi:putative peptidoglycan lipid II flippase